MDMDTMQLLNKAHQKFGFINRSVIYFSPGRINIIGEHIDYNGGHVLPCTLDIGTYGVAALRDDNKILCYSEQFEELGVIVISLDDLKYKNEDEWGNYIKGVAKEMNIPRGFDLYVSGNIPTSAGLSSSASLEILIASIINDLFNLDYEPLELVKIAHRAETNFVGVNCGIMDQFVIGMAKNHQAILLNTVNLEYSPVTVDLDDKTIIIGNTNKPRKLSDSKYNERRNECNVALRLLQKKVNIYNLCDLSYREFLPYRYLLKDDILLRRATHAILENERTKSTYMALLQKDFYSLGRLLNESHKSLKELYQVTGFELDTIVNLFIQYGAIGARMTGAGFGGCAIALIDKLKVDEVISRVKEDYQKITGLTPSFYHVNIGNGVTKL